MNHDGIPISPRTYSFAGVELAEMTSIWPVKAARTTVGVGLRLSIGNL